MRILVTGGCGYVGSHVVRALVRAGAERVVVVDDLSTGHLSTLPAEGVRFLRADVADRALLRAMVEERIDAVAHLAGRIDVAESVRDPLAYYRGNVAHGLALFESAIAAKVGRFVLSSSAAVYGEPIEVPIPEEHRLAPVSPYGESKRILERALESFGRAYGTRWVSLRYFNAAGATPDEGLGERHDPETHLVPLAVAAALGERAPLLVYGDDHATPDGTCVRDYVHVRDLADAHALAIAHLERGGESGPVNLGTGAGASVAEVIRAVERATKRAVPRVVGPRRPGDPAVLVASNARARERLGWAPRHDLDAIVRDAVRFHQSVALPK